MELNLVEEFLLIALDDDKGAFVIDSTHLHYGFAGAVLLELAVRDKIDIDGDYLHLKSSSQEPEVALNMAIGLIMSGTKTKKVKDWLDTLAKKAGEMKEATLQRLIERGVLRKEEHKILWIIPNNKYPTSNSNPENKVRERLNNVILNGAQSEPRDVMLLSLIDVSDLTKEAFRDQSDYKEVKRKIKEVTEDIKISQAINKSIREIQTAIMISIATTMVVTTVITSNN
ncbi:MAG: GPP34 family phosphoprotein [Roseivirga sp.]|nr:GPP34 family phosphoprotein [Roseivirga sp.]